MKTVSFKGQIRDKAARAAVTRNEGRIPAVIYGGEVNEQFSVTMNDIKSLIYTPDFKLGELELDGSKYRCIVQDVQYHPITDNIVHVDFLAIENGRKVKVDVPIRFKGVSPGVKEGGTLMQSMRRVQIKVDPEHLVEEMILDISELNLGFSVKVKDIEVDENIEIMVSPNIPVASVEVPRALKSLEEEEAEAAVLEAAALEAAGEGEGGEGAGEGDGKEKPSEDAAKKD